MRSSAPSSARAPARAIAIAALALALGACSGGDDPAATTDVQTLPDITVVDVGQDTSVDEDTGECACPANIPVCGHYECVNGACTVIPAEVGSACDDGLPCTTAEKCVAEADGLVCRSDTSTCGDGDLCNGAELCTPTGCAPGAALVCADEDPCNGTELCAPSIGCLDGTPLVCDDGDPCDGAEQCAVGSGCVASEPLSCDDGSACTDDACDGAAGCVHTPSGAAGCCTTDAQCDDNSACTKDTCEANGACTNTPTAAACDDGDPCTADDTCAQGQCGGEPRAGCRVICTVTHSGDGLGDCDVRLAALASPTATELDVGIAWSGSALLVGLLERQCAGPLADGGPGTSCGVSVLPAGGQFGGAHVVYADPVVLSSWPREGRLTMSPLVDDAAPLSGATIAGDGIDGDPFVLGLRLNAESGTSTTVVAYELAARAGETPLTAAVLPAFAASPGLIVTTPTPCGSEPCFDGNPCTQDLCTDGVCSFPLATGACDDGDDCTAVSSCDALGDCVATLLAPKGAPCAGADKCVDVGTCSELGVCEFDPTLAPTCEGDGVCTDAACDPKTGACLVDIRTGSTCDDGDACTESDACSVFGECTGFSMDCDDGVPCTLDSCTAGTCVHTPSDALCEDGLPCSTNTCSAEKGCQSVVSGGACDDGDVCTVADTCITASLCQGTPAPGCGCTSAADCAKYDDNDLCNGSMACTDGHCQLDPASVVTCPYDGVECKADWTCQPATGKCAGSPVQCDDKDPCTTDACSPIFGCTHTLVVGCAENWLCEVSGSAGDVVLCPVQLARASKDATPASSADLVFTWDAALTIQNLQDTACYGSVCFDYDLVGCDSGPCVTETISPSGHTLIVAPEKMSQWTSWLSLFLFHLGAPDTAFNASYLDAAGEPTTDPTLFVLRFVLATAVSESTPAKVFAKDLAVQPASGEPLVARVKSTSVGRVIVTD